MPQQQIKQTKVPVEISSFLMKLTFQWWKTDNNQIFIRTYTHESMLNDINAHRKKQEREIGIIILGRVTILVRVAREGVTGKISVKVKKVSEQTHLFPGEKENY